MRPSLLSRPKDLHTERCSEGGDDAKSRNKDYESALCAASPPKDVTGGPQVSIVCGYYLVCVIHCTDNTIITPLHWISPGCGWCPRVRSYFRSPTLYKYPRHVAGWDTHNEKLQFPPTILSLFRALHFVIECLGPPNSVSVPNSKIRWRFRKQVIIVLCTEFLHATAHTPAWGPNK